MFRVLHVQPAQRDHSNYMIGECVIRKVGSVPTRDGALRYAADYATGKGVGFVEVRTPDDKGLAVFPFTNNAHGGSIAVQLIDLAVRPTRANP